MENFEKLNNNKKIDNPDLETVKNKEILPVNFEVYYSAHETTADIGDFKKTFDKCDIFVPEAYGGDEILQNLLQNLSDGVITPEQALENIELKENVGHFTEQVKIIYNSHKKILIADVTEKEIAIGRGDKESSEAIDTMLNSNDFDEVIGAVNKLCKNVAEGQKKREGKIIENLQEKLKKYLEDRGQVSEGERQKVLLSLGASHTSVAHGLKKEGHEVSSIFDKLPFVVPVQAEAIRRHIFGKELDRDFLARTWLAIRLAQNDDPTKPSMEHSAKVRKIVADLNYDEIKELFYDSKKTKRS